MEEATAEQISQESALEAEKKGEDQQEVSYVNGQGFVQNQNYNQNPNVRNNPQLFSYRRNNMDNPADQVQNNKAQGVGYQKNFPQNF